MFGANGIAEQSAWRATGDARLRWEALRHGSEEPEHRVRLRLREEIHIDADEDWALSVGLTTGRRADPRDPDWRLGDGSPAITLRIAPAWARWYMSTGGTPTSLTVGRMPMPFLRVLDLVFDGDWHPVGISADGTFGPQNSLVRGHAGTFWLADFGKPAWRLHTTQLAWDWLPTQSWRTLLGGSMFWHAEAEHETPLIPPHRAPGNQLTYHPADPRARLASDFHVLEGFALITWDPWLPLSVFGQTIANTAASSELIGWLVGISIGATRAVGGIELGWSYRELQANSTVAALADSDFGGTALHAHRLQLRWQALRGLWIGFSWRSVQPLGPTGPSPFDLWQADVLWRF